MARGSPVPFGGRCCVQRYALATQVRCSQCRLFVHVALLSGPAKPLDRCRVVRRSVLTDKMPGAEAKLSVGVVRFGDPTESGEVTPPICHGRGRYHNGLQYASCSTFSTDQPSDNMRFRILSLGSQVHLISWCWVAYPSACTHAIP